MEGSKARFPRVVIGRDGLAVEAGLELWDPMRKEPVTEPGKKTFSSATRSRSDLHPSASRDPPFSFLGRIPPPLRVASPHPRSRAQQPRRADEQRAHQPSQRMRPNSPTPRPILAAAVCIDRGALSRSQRPLISNTLWESTETIALRPTAPSPQAQRLGQPRAERRFPMRVRTSVFASRYRHSCGSCTSISLSIYRSPCTGTRTTAPPICISRLPNANPSAHSRVPVQTNSQTTRSVSTLRYVTRR